MAVENSTCFEFSPLACPHAACMCSQNFFVHWSLTGELRASGLLCILMMVLLFLSLSPSAVNIDMIVSDLERAGFVLNVNNCCLAPCETGKWLGFIVNLPEGKFQVPYAS